MLESLHCTQGFAWKGNADEVRQLGTGDSAVHTPPSDAADGGREGRRLYVHHFPDRDGANPQRPRQSQMEDRRGASALHRLGPPGFVLEALVSDALSAKDGLDSTRRLRIRALYMRVMEGRNDGA